MKERQEKAPECGRGAWRKFRVFDEECGRPADGTPIREMAKKESAAKQ